MTLGWLAGYRAISPVLREHRFSSFHVRTDLETEKHQNVRSVYIVFNLSVQYRKVEMYFQGTQGPSYHAYMSSSEEKKPNHLC